MQYCRPRPVSLRSVTATDDSPRAVVADFLWVVPLDGAKVTLEHCLELMPLLEGLWKVQLQHLQGRVRENTLWGYQGGFLHNTFKTNGHHYRKVLDGRNQ